MISPNVSRAGYTFLLVRFAYALCASCIFTAFTNADAQVSPSPTATTAPHIPESLKGKSNEELVHLLIGGKSTLKLKAEARRANEVETHFPDHFWEMPPKDAALALVQENCNLKLKTQLKISVRDDKGRPPDKGRVQLRFESAYYNVPREALMNLESDGRRSTLRYSNVELRGPVKRSLVEAAIRRTTRCGLPTEEARRLYEIIWWLGRIQFARPERKADADEATTERIIATHSVHGKLSVEPGGPQKREFTLCGASLSECYQETFDDDLYADFVDFILRDTLKRHGVNLDETTDVLGEETYSSAEEKFVLTTKPPPPNDPATAKWIERMLNNLERYRYSVISDLAPIDEPLRYPDSRIDDAFFRLLRGGLSPHGLDRKTDERGFKDSADAARALAGRKRSHAFPIIMQLLEVRNDNVRDAQNDLLEAATLLASTQADYRQELIEYLTAQLNRLADSPHFTSGLFDSVWRGDFRELTPLLEKMATASPDEIEDEHGSSWMTPSRPVVGRFHDARRILIAWKEPDSLTRLKLDAIIQASTAYLGGPAEFLGQEFAALSEDERRAFKEFVRWLEEYRPIDTSWYPEPLEKVLAIGN
ncbi:MAG: hypothetical protein QOC70_593 [Verrucomicrobiota bacterium]|jgi:hypothetical protein